MHHMLRPTSKIKIPEKPCGINQTQMANGLFEILLRSSNSSKVASLSSLKHEIAGNKQSNNTDIHPACGKLPVFRSCLFQLDP